MKLTEMNKGGMTKMDTLIILAINKNDYIFAMPGQPIKRTSDSLLDLDLPIVTDKNEMINAVNKADHKEQWYSMLNKEITLKFLNN